MIRILVLRRFNGLFDFITWIGKVDAQRR